MTKNPEILVSRTDLERCGFNRERVRSALARIQPAKVERRARYYDLTTAVSAALAEGETGREREARLRGDMLEERLRRMRGETLDAQEVRFFFAETLIRIRDVIRTSGELPNEVKTRVTGLLRHEVDSLRDRLIECEFKESNPENEKDDTNEETSND
jgi:hypothetical protein